MSAWKRTLQAMEGEDWSGKVLRCKPHPQNGHVQPSFVEIVHCTGCHVHGCLNCYTNLPVGGSKASQQYAATAAKSLQSCPTLCDLIDGRPTGSPVPGILQARTLEWVARPPFFDCWKYCLKEEMLFSNSPNSGL